ncbi:hypothetical protein FRC11_005471 [Ceratobasidium sp. 423]|nr:hypothetical protein FRC11_005471 [Ceratobasidium sp. 423]
MPKDSPKNLAKFTELFSLRTHQAGATSGPCPSPDGIHLLLSTPGSLVLIDTRIGGTQAFADTGATVDITAVVWISNTRGLIGCSNGTVYEVDFHAANLFGYSPVSISYAFTDIKETILVLRYNLDQGILAIGYEFGVSVWQNRNSTWNRINHMELTLPFDEPLGISTVEILDSPEQHIFLSGSFGHGTWQFSSSAPFCADARAFSALSRDGRYLALSSLKQSVHVWSIGAKGPCSGNAKRFELTSGKDFAHLSSRIPIAMTQANIVVSGSQEGEIFLTDLKNRVLGRFCAEPNLAITGIQCHADRLYISMAGPFSSVLIKCYSNKPNSVREFEGRSAFGYGLAYTDSSRN